MIRDSVPVSYITCVYSLPVLTICTSTHVRQSSRHVSSYKAENISHKGKHGVEVVLSSCQTRLRGLLASSVDQVMTDLPVP